MMLNKLFYTLATAFQNLKKQLLMNLVVSVMIAVTFLISIIFLVVLLNLSTFKQNWISNLNMIVYLTDNASEEKVATTVEIIGSFKEVSQVRYVSPEDAMESLKLSLRGQEGLLESLQYNPLPASIEIALKEQYLNLETVQEIALRIGGNPWIGDIEYGREWLERFIAFFDLIRVLAITLGIFLLVFTVFIVSNTIRLLIYSRRDEIEIMKLVGATDRFIILPFCVEGIVQGITGAGLSLLTAYLFFNIVASDIIGTFYFYFGAMEPVFINAYIACLVLVSGIIIGFAGSIFSLKTIEELKS